MKPQIRAKVNTYKTLTKVLKEKNGLANGHEYSLIHSSFMNDIKKRKGNNYENETLKK